MCKVRAFWKDSNICEFDSHMPTKLLNKNIMEEWKIIKEFPNYSVSNTGKVINIKRNKLMSIYKKENGYLVVKLSRSNQSFEKRVHRLVAQAFIPNINNLPHINHKDENPTNNNVDNLEWCDNQYNNTYGARCERQAKKLYKPVIQYDKNMNFIAEYPSINAAGESCNIKPFNISNCISGRQKTAGNYIWKYKF